MTNELNESIRMIMNIRIMNQSIRNECARMIIDECARAMRDARINEDMIDLISDIAIIIAFARELISLDANDVIHNELSLIESIDSFNSSFGFLDIDAYIQFDMQQF